MNKHFLALLLVINIIILIGLIFIDFDFIIKVIGSGVVSVVYAFIVNYILKNCEIRCPEESESSKEGGIDTFKTNGSMFDLLKNYRPQSSQIKVLFGEGLILKQSNHVDNTHNNNDNSHESEAEKQMEIRDEMYRTEYSVFDHYEEDPNFLGNKNDTPDMHHVGTPAYGENVNGFWLRKYEEYRPISFEDWWMVRYDHDMPRKYIYYKRKQQKSILSEKDKTLPKVLTGIDDLTSSVIDENTGEFKKLNREKIEKLMNVNRNREIGILKGLYTQMHNIERDERLSVDDKGILKELSIIDAFRFNKAQCHKSIVDLINADDYNVFHNTAIDILIKELSLRLQARMTNTYKNKYTKWFGQNRDGVSKMKSDLLKKKIELEEFIKKTNHKLEKLLKHDAYKESDEYTAQVTDNYRFIDLANTQLLKVINKLNEIDQYKNENKETFNNNNLAANQQAAEMIGDRNLNTLEIIAIIMADTRLTYNTDDKNYIAFYLLSRDVQYHNVRSVKEYILTQIINDHKNQQLLLNFSKSQELINLQILYFVINYFELNNPLKEHFKQFLTKTDIQFINSLKLYANGKINVDQINPNKLSGILKLKIFKVRSLIERIDKSLYYRLINACNDFNNNYELITKAFPSLLYSFEYPSLSLINSDIKILPLIDTTNELHEIHQTSPKQIFNDMIYLNYNYVQNQHNPILISKTRALIDNKISFDAVQDHLIRIFKDK